MTGILGSDCPTMSVFIFYIKYLRAFHGSDKIPDVGPSPNAQVFVKSIT